jgi:methylglyoxal synthase
MLFPPFVELAGVCRDRRAVDCLMLFWRTVMKKIIAMARRKNIALVAHDNKKEELVEWAQSNCKLLAEHSLYSTRTTGQLLKSRIGLSVTLLESGPLGGDQQIGSRITEGEINFVIFFSDPLRSHPHDADVKALLRVIVVWNVPVACNRASADFILSSPLMSAGYERIVADYAAREARCRTSPERVVESTRGSHNCRPCEITDKKERARSPSERIRGQR